VNNINFLKNSRRHDIVKLLKSKSENIGVELGVAKGVFSSRMVSSGYFSHFFGVDIYSDTYHDTDEYKETLVRIGVFSNYKLFRMSFDDALDLFEDESLDFVYIDGYAHNGEEGGQTIFNWSKKVKIGGVIAGDDYHEDWPLVVDAVNEFIKSTGFKLNLTLIVEDDLYSNYPSWAVIKTTETKNKKSPNHLVKKGRIAQRPKKNLLKYSVNKIVHLVLNKKIINFIKSIR
jgi:hypothetical protein